MQYLENLPKYSLIFAGIAENNEDFKIKVFQKETSMLTT